MTRVEKRGRPGWQTGAKYSRLQFGLHLTFKGAARQPGRRASHHQKAHNRPIWPTGSGQRARRSAGARRVASKIAPAATSRAGPRGQQAGLWAGGRAGARTARGRDLHAGGSSARQIFGSIGARRAAAATVQAAPRCAMHGANLFPLLLIPNGPHFKSRFSTANRVRFGRSRLGSCPLWRWSSLKEGRQVARPRGREAGQPDEPIESGPLLSRAGAGAKSGGKYAKDAPGAGRRRPAAGHLGWPSSLGRPVRGATRPAAANPSTDKRTSGWPAGRPIKRAPSAGLFAPARRRRAVKALAFRSCKCVEWGARPARLGFVAFAFAGANETRFGRANERSFCRRRRSRSLIVARHNRGRPSRAARLRFCARRDKRAARA